LTLNLRHRTVVHLLPEKIMQSIEFPLKGEYIELCNLLKLAGVAESGGRGKTLVAEGRVTVDGQPESRKTAKIRVGQVVECMGVQIAVVGL
jgi:ribosome-associated protein